VDTRSEGSFGGAVGLLPSPVAVRDPGDPAAVATPTKTLRVVIGGPRAVDGPAGTVPKIMPGPRGGADDATTQLPAIRADGPPGVPRTRRTSEEAATRERGGAATPTHARRGTVQGGTVLLPLRLFLGGAFLVEGLRKLYAPGFLDPSSTESFGHRIGVLRDGSLSPSVMDLAADHAIGAGLLFAFGQVVVGFAVVLGLWTRLAGLAGMLLSLGVLIAVGSGSSPYHAPYVVFLAAFSPLALAGAPMYSADAWLSLRIWRGPIVTPVRARRRKLGYGSMLAFAGVGATLLAGSLLGGGHRHVDESDTGRMGGTLAPVVPGSSAGADEQQDASVATQPRPPVTEPEPSAPQSAKASAQPGPVAPRSAATTAPGRSAAPPARTGTGTGTAPTSSAPEQRNDERKGASPAANPASGKAPASASGSGAPARASGGTQSGAPKSGGPVSRPLGGLLG
jgi:uncharacterized membrane protein YphA (DoxX/SURF4 family)